MVKGIPLECNFIAHKEDSVNYARSLKKYIMMNGERALAIIDSGAMGNFISKQLVDKFGTITKLKEDPYDLMVIDGNSLPSDDGRVRYETTPVTLVMSDHEEKLSLDTVRMASHDIVLGAPWLQHHNPSIDRMKKQLKFEKYRYVATTQPTRRQRTVVEEKQSIRHTAKRKIAASIKDDDRDQSDSRRSRQGQSGHKRRVIEGIHAPSESRGDIDTVQEPPENKVPDVYRRWIHLFREEESAKALPKHKPWDHEIQLMPGEAPKFGPIYPLSKTELGVLREYLDTNLKKRSIRKSESSAGYPILSTPKKDGELRLRVDYRKLNDIMIKNRYPLPSISELQDRLQGAKIFTKIDLRGAYNLVRIRKGQEWMTAFRTRYGIYKYTVMPFGLTNAPATCQELVNNALKKYLDIFVIAYLDDILIYSKDETEHVRHVHTALRCLDEWDLLS